MYRNKRTDIKEFAQFVLDNPNNKQSYQIFDKGGVQYTLISDTVKHDKRNHELSAEDWSNIINSLEHIVYAEKNGRSNTFGNDNIVLETEYDGKNYRIIITQSGNQNKITSAFPIKKARLPAPDFGNFGSVSSDTTGAPSGHDVIIEQLRSYVKAIPDKNADSAGKVYHQDGKLDIRGYFDWSNKMQQIIQIMKTGDLDTVLHELGHFFSVNYINMAIESGKLDNVRPLMDYYKVANPQELIYNEEIQEDLAVKFLSQNRPKPA